MKYEVGLSNREDSYIEYNGNPFIIATICTCGDIKDALLVAKNHDDECFIPFIKDKDDETKKWIKYDEYPVKKIENIKFATVPEQWNGRDSRIMWNKINEIIDYINENK